MINGGDDDEMDVLHKRRCCRSQSLDVENITQMASLHRGGKERLGGEGSLHTIKEGVFQSDSCRRRGRIWCKDAECKSEVVRLRVSKPRSNARLVDIAFICQASPSAKH